MHLEVEEYARPAFIYESYEIKCAVCCRGTASSKLAQPEQQQHCRQYAAFVAALSDTACCNICGLVVHKNCYASAECASSNSNWHCIPCSRGEVPALLHCAVCNRTEGGLQLLPDFRTWVHVLCLQWTHIGKLSPKSLQPMLSARPLSNVASNVESKLQPPPCSVCNSSTGLRAVCQHRGCRQAFHLSCCSGAGYVRAGPELSGTARELYCVAHRADALAGEGSRAVRTLESLRRVAVAELKPEPAAAVSMQLEQLKKTINSCDGLSAFKAAVRRVIDPLAAGDRAVLDAALWPLMNSFSAVLGLSPTAAAAAACPPCAAAAPAAPAAAAAAATVAVQQNGSSSNSCSSSKRHRAVASVASLLNSTTTVVNSPATTRQRSVMFTADCDSDNYHSSCSSSSSSSTSSSSSGLNGGSSSSNSSGTEFQLIIDGVSPARSNSGDRTITTSAEAAAAAAAVAAAMAVDESESVYTESLCCRTSSEASSGSSDIHSDAPLELDTAHSKRSAMFVVNRGRGLRSSGDTEAVSSTAAAAAAKIQRRSSSSSSSSSSKKQRSYRASPVQLHRTRSKALLTAAQCDDGYCSTEPVTEPVTELVSVAADIGPILSPYFASPSTPSKAAVAVTYVAADPSLISALSQQCVSPSAAAAAAAQAQQQQQQQHCRQLQMCSDSDHSGSGELDLMCADDDSQGVEEDWLQQHVQQVQFQAQFQQPAQFEAQLGQPTEQQQYGQWQHQHWQQQQQQQQCAARRDEEPPTLDDLKFRDTDLDDKLCCACSRYVETHTLLFLSVMTMPIHSVCKHASAIKQGVYTNSLHSVIALAERVCEALR
jgi:PHD-zinc-finger like domain